MIRAAEGNLRRLSLFMKLVVQRVTQGKVSVEGETVGEIGKCRILLTVPTTML